MSANHSAGPGGIIGISFRFFFNMKVCLGDSNEHTQYTIFNTKKETHPKIFQFCSNGVYFPRDYRNSLRNSLGKRDISVRATEGLLNTCGVVSLRSALPI